MPRAINPDDEKPWLIEDQIIAVWEKTNKEDREFIAQAWAMDYSIDLKEFVTNTGLPPIALIVASLIDTEHPLLVSPGRGVMYSAVGCAVIVIGLMATGAKIGTPLCMDVIAKLVPKPKISLVKKKPAKDKKFMKVVPVPS